MDTIKAGGIEFDLGNSSDAFGRLLKGYRDYLLPENHPEYDPDVGSRHFWLDVTAQKLLGVTFGVLTRQGTAEVWYQENMHYIWASDTQLSNSSVGLILKTVWLYWYRLIIQALIIFYSIVHEVFLKLFLDGLAETVIIGAYGLNQISMQHVVKYEANVCIENGWSAFWAFKDGGDPNGPAFGSVMVGHSATGIYVKETALKYNLEAVVFESGQYELSPPSFFLT
jgi:hypothetical protein